MQMIQFRDENCLASDKSQRPSRHRGQSLLSNPGTPLENNRTT